MKKIFAILFSVAVLVLTFESCLRPPTEEMNQAIEAVVRAENDPDAMLYATSTVSRAKDALVQMQTEADERRYDSAKNYAAEATAAAEKAIADGKAGAERARSDAAALLRSVEAEINETQNALNAARSVRGVRLNFTSLESTLANTRYTYDSAAQSLRNGNYPDAVTKAQSIRPILANMRSQISNAVASVSPRKK